MILEVPYVYPMKARMPRQRNDREFHVRSSVMVRCAAPDESEAPVVLRWHPATPLGGKPDPDGPVVDFRFYEGQLYRTFVRKEPYGEHDRKILSPHAAVALANQLDNPHNPFLGGAGPLGEFDPKRYAAGEPKDESEVEEMIVAFSGKERVLAAIHAFAERTLWIGNEVMVRSGEPLYILEETWGSRARRASVKTSDDLGLPHLGDYPSAEQIYRVDGIDEVLAAASQGEGEFDSEDPTTFRHLLPAYVEVFDPSVLGYVHDQTPVFRFRVQCAVDQMRERVANEPVPVMTAWGHLRDVLKIEGVAGAAIADAVRDYAAAVELCYPTKGRLPNWRAENMLRELEVWEYAPILDEQTAPSMPGPR